ncbi:MAG TPA: hypothetical protein DD400_00645 [Rhodospirillaceae bacterium]|nr:hypothetical protein [Rhodospirillaceae bacterium]
MRYVLHFGPEVLHIDMEGIFTFADSRDFHHMMSALTTKEGRGEIRLNVHRLESVDCTALSLLMQAHDFAKRVHRVLVFVEPKGQVLDALTRAAAYNGLRIAA